MTVVVLGLDALDPDLVGVRRHPNLTLSYHREIETIVSSAGEPSTHELWPTMITGLHPEEHGLVLDDGVAWGNPVIERAADAADGLVPDAIQTRIGAWLLNNTSADAFREPAGYYEEEGIQTVFDGRDSLAIGVPNYVTDPDEADREHRLRRQLGDLFERDPDATGGHASADPATLYEQCMEMLMVRVARVRRALRSGRYELVFGYTSALDLVGHVAYEVPELQDRAYAEADAVVGELADDLEREDELLVVSDHGLREGVHTETAMAAGTDEAMVQHVDSVLDVREAIEAELAAGNHAPDPRVTVTRRDDGRAAEVRQQLRDLGYT